MSLSSIFNSQNSTRARDIGIPFEGTPGKYNAVTDVKGLKVGLTTIIEGNGSLKIGSGPVRTGVTAILPRGKTYDPVFAGWHSLNGNGEMTGTTWISESGFLEGPLMITNTHSVGVVRDAVAEWQFKHEFFDSDEQRDRFWTLPVVAETYDGVLNDINGFHVTKEDAFKALESTESGPVDEGGVGGGTGMICHGFKGGTGTSSRVVKVAGSNYTVGVLVQANYGVRRTLTVAGIPMGKEIDCPENEVKFGESDEPLGSIIVAVATDAPLLPHQLNRLARRVPLGIARVGGYGANNSGDIFIAFSTANGGAASRTSKQQLNMLPNDLMDPLLEATPQATEEAILNALTAAETMTGRNDNTIYELPHSEVKRLLKKHKRYTAK